LRRCTHAGKPFADEPLVKEMSIRFDRHWERGRPKRDRAAAAVTGQMDTVE